jgi:hypothetical protein
MVKFTTLLEVVISETKKSRNMVKLVRVEYDLGTPIIIQIGSWMHGIKPSKLMVSLRVQKGCPKIKSPNLSCSKKIELSEFQISEIFLSEIFYIRKESFPKAKKGSN